MWNLLCEIICKSVREKWFYSIVAVYNSDNGMLKIYPNFKDSSNEQ